MARAQDNTVDFTRILGRIGVGILLVFLLGLFLLWRIDNPRAERFRSAIVDRVVPNMDWAMVPVTKVTNMIRDFQSYDRIYQQNQELRRELQQMKAWREAAIQLEQENARLLDLNNVKLNAQMSFLSGELLTDSGSPFRQSAIVNIGSRDGVIEGWAAMDGLGLVGRIAGVGENSARVIFVTDTSSHIPVSIKPSDQKAIMTGDNTLLPPLSFIESLDQVKPGDRVVTSGDGGVFPPDLLAGQVTLGADGQMRVRLSADFRRLKFLRVIRHKPIAPIVEPDRLIGPVLPTDIPPEASLDINGG